MMLKASKNLPHTCTCKLYFLFIVTLAHYIYSCFRSLLYLFFVLLTLDIKVLSACRFKTNIFYTDWPVCLLTFRHILENMSTCTCMFQVVMQPDFVTYWKIHVQYENRPAGLAKYSFYTNVKPFVSLVSSTTKTNNHL